MEQKARQFAVIAKDILAQSGFTCPEKISAKDAGFLHEIFACVQRAKGSVNACLNAWTALEQTGFEAPEVTPMSVIRSIAAYAEA